MSLKQRTLDGLSWSFIAQIGKQAGQFIITAILARLLSLNDFGLLGMATVFSGFISVFSDMGIGGALIQKQTLNEEHFSSAFWVNVFVGCLLMLIFWLAAPGIANFYRARGLEPILKILSITFLISSFGIVQQAVLMKKMDFRGLMIRDISAVVIGGIAGIAAALNGYGVWSLVLQQIVFTIVNSFALWWFSPWKPKWKFSFQAIRQLFHFSANTTGFQVVNYVARNIDYLLIGKFLGADSLGVYTLAYKLMLVPLQNISWVVHRVMFPAFSKIQGQLEKIRVNYLLLVKAIALMAFPIMVSLFVLAPEFVVLVYGEKWLEVVNLIRILCFCGLLQSISTTAGIIYMSQDRVDTLLRLAVANTAVIAGMIAFGLHYGLNGVAGFYLAGTTLTSHVTLYMVCKLIQLPFSIFYRNLAGLMARAFLLLCVLLLAKSLIQADSILKLIVIGVIGAITHLVLSRDILLAEGWLSLLTAPLRMRPKRASPA